MTANYDISYVNATESVITQKALTVTAPTGITKVYSGTTDATGITLVSGLVTGDVKHTEATLTYDTKLVATGKTVTPSAIVIWDGASADMTANYDISYVNATDATITKKTLTISGSFTAYNKLFDNTTSAVINNNSLSLVGIINPDVVNLTPVAAFASAAVGNTITVNLTSSSSLDNGNYSISLVGAPTTTANIVAASTPDITNSDGSTATVATVTGSTLGYMVPNRGSGFTYVWELVDVPTTNVLLVSPGSPNYAEVTWNETGSLKVTEFYSGSGTDGTDQIAVTVTPIALKGNITYKNAANTPMGNVTVSLLNASNVSLGSTTTSPTGYYQFATMPSGTVAKIQVSTAKTWGGGNSTDALAMSRRAIGNPPGFWLADMAHIDEVGDVNATNIVNATDALLVKHRAIQLVSSFAAGDWSFYSPSDNLMFENSALGTALLAYTPVPGTIKDIQAMCYGDVNGSFTPGASKSSIAVLSDSIINIGSGQLFELPVKVENSMDLSALTLYLNYASDKLEVLDVKSDLPDLMFNVKDGSINMAWSEIQPVSIADRGKLITLVLKSKATITSEDELFTCNGISEFANKQGETIQPVNLVINRLDNTGAYGLSDNLSMEYGFTVSPNPFGSTAKIAVTLPERADVKITLLNSVGKAVAVLADQTMDMGLNSWPIPAESLDLPNGVYFVHLEATGKQSSCSRTLKVIHIK